MFDFIIHFTSKDFLDHIKSNIYVICTSILGSLILYIFAVLSFCRHFNLSIAYFDTSTFYSTFMIFMFLLLCFFFTMSQLSLAYRKNFNKILETKSSNILAMIWGDIIMGKVGSTKALSHSGFYKPYIKNSWPSIIHSFFSFYIFQLDFNIPMKIYIIAISAAIYVPLLWMIKQYAAAHNVAYSSIFLLGLLLFYSNEISPIELNSPFVCFLILCCLFLSNVNSVSLIINALFTDKQLGGNVISIILPLLVCSRYILSFCLSYLNLGSISNAEIKDINTNETKFIGEIILITEKKIFCRKSENDSISVYSGHDHFVNIPKKK